MTTKHFTRQLFICHREGYQDAIRLDAPSYEDAVQVAACGLECRRADVIVRYVKTMTGDQSSFDRWNAMEVK